MKLGRYTIFRHSYCFQDELIIQNVYAIFGLDDPFVIYLPKRPIFCENETVCNFWTRWPFLG